MARQKRKSRIHKAAEDGDVERLRFCIANGDDVNEVYIENWTPLHAAALEGQLDAVKFLVDNGADPNFVEDQFGATPFHKACLEGNILAVKYLLEHGADPSILTNLGDTPLIYACQSIDASPDLLELLLAQGNDIDHQNGYGDTALHAAIESHKYEAIDYLFQQGASLEIANIDGLLPEDTANFTKEFELALNLRRMRLGIQ